MVPNEFSLLIKKSRNKMNESDLSEWEKEYALMDAEMDFMTALLMMDALSLNPPVINNAWDWRYIPGLSDMIRMHNPQYTGLSWATSLFQLIMRIRMFLGSSGQGDVFKFEGIYYLLPGDICDSILDAASHQDAEDSERFWDCDMRVILANVLDRRTTNN
jgi:hypothetical protein